MARLELGAMAGQAAMQNQIAQERLSNVVVVADREKEMNAFLCCRGAKFELVGKNDPRLLGLGVEAGELDKLEAAINEKSFVPCYCCIGTSFEFMLARAVNKMQARGIIVSLKKSIVIEKPDEFEEIAPARLLFPTDALTAPQAQVMGVA